MAYIPVIVPSGKPTRPRFVLSNGLAANKLAMVATSIATALLVMAVPLLVLISGLPTAVSVAIAMLLLAIPIAIPLIVRRRGWAWVDVGADGLARVDRKGSSFLPYARVMAVRAVGAAVDVQLTDGTVVLYPLSHAPTQAALVAAANFVRAIEQARAAFAARERAAVPPVLLPGERAGEAWLRDVRALRDGTAASGYREEAVAPDTLWRVIEDPAADASARAAAAIAVAPRNPEERTRVRVAAETTAEPRLRVALERIAEGDDAGAEAIATTLAR